jgi:aryl-alcohol dehydrogenase-like predicted oxidoreductase
MSAPSTTTVRIENSKLSIYPLVLGTNTFTNPSAPQEYHAVLDSFVERGGNFIDTADAYSYWVPGNSGGESEMVIGQWLTSRGNRDDVIIGTKVSGKPNLPGLKPETIAKGAEESLRRLQTDHIDLYYAHAEDDQTPIVESAAAFDQLVTEGKVRAVALSNFSHQAIDEWFRVAQENGFTKPVALQPQYSLVTRQYEQELADTAKRHGLSVFPYQVLAAGFLSGKYRTEADTQGRTRGGAVKGYLTPEGLKVLDALDEVAAVHGTDPASVALAWATANGKTTAPIASATTLAQLDQLFAAAALRLTEEQVAQLDKASAPFA